MAAFDVLVALCTGCVQNLRLVVDTLIEMYYSGESRRLARRAPVTHPAAGHVTPRAVVRHDISSLFRFGFE